jgi:hypothetical protein
LFQPTHWIIVKSKHILLIGIEIKLPAEIFHLHTTHTQRLSVKTNQLHDGFPVALLISASQPCGLIGHGLPLLVSDGQDVGAKVPGNTSGSTIKISCYTNTQGHGVFTAKKKPWK